MKFQIGNWPSHGVPLPGMVRPVQVVLTLPVAQLEVKPPALEVRVDQRRADLTSNPVMAGRKG